MLKKRLIARLDVKGSHLIKGVRMDGWRKLGDPGNFCLEYDRAGIDEIIYMDVVASLYGRNGLLSLVSRTCADVFTPLTVGGGVSSVEDVRELLNAGADKVAVNTAVLERPELITEISNKFGAQCMVLSIEAKNTGSGWMAYSNNGRDRSNKSVVDWAIEGEKLGAGEILLSSVDQDGTNQGMDREIIQKVAGGVSVPVVASGGVGSNEDVVAGFVSGAAGVAVASALHYKKISVSAIRDYCLTCKIPVREII